MKFLHLIILSLTAVLNTSAQQLIIQVKDKDDNMWSYIDINGNYIFPEKFKKCFEFDKSGFAVIYDKKSIYNYKFIDTKGNFLQTEIKDFVLKNVLGFGVKGFYDGFVAVGRKGKWGFIGTDGKILGELKYDKVNLFSHGYAAVRYKGEWLIIDKSGNETKPEIDNIEDIRVFKEGLAPFKTLDNKKMGYIDTEGKIAVNPLYISLGYFSSGLAWVKTISNKIGYIDKQGNLKIDPVFNDAKDFDEESGLARVKKGDIWTYIDKTGKEVIINISIHKSDFNEGLCPGIKGELYGFYDKENTWVIEPQFNDVRGFKNGYASVKKGEFWGLINKKGEWVIQPRFISMKDAEIIE